MPGYAYFFLAFAILILGYFFYSKFVEQVYSPNYGKATPAITKHDEVDFVVLPSWKIFLIQLLNIAGLGPVFGALSGALFGPVALLWIAFGCVLGGAVHDFLSAMLSLRHAGANLPEIIGYYLGRTAQITLRILCIVLCILVGAVFVMGPAGIMASITPMSVLSWTIIIFVYYFLATILPIQTLIGRIYPLFGVVLIFMAVGVICMLFIKGYTILPNTDFFSNYHPEGIPIWPMLFVTIACGAISGFHATQSPIMVRCMKKARDGRKLFYGSMIAEGVIALIWATVGLSFYDSQALFAQALAAEGTPAGVVKEVCQTLLGPTGAVIALIGVVALPVTTGDTALRCARLMMADVLKMTQSKIWKRLAISIPIFSVCILLTMIDFNIVWRYFGWLNQTIAAMTLWSVSVYLKKHGKLHWITTLPAAFMTAICTTYLLYDKTGFQLSYLISTGCGAGVAGILLVIFLFKVRKAKLEQ